MIEPVFQGGSLRSPWPDDFGGYERRIGPFEPCAQCGTGTWVRYGDEPTCLGCATGKPAQA